MIIRSNLLAALVLSGCSTLDPLEKNPFEDETAEIESCMTGMGEPDESYYDRKIDTAWMAEDYYYNAHVECLGFPKLRIGSDEDGEWPISYLLLNVADYNNGAWVEKLGTALTVTMDGEEIDVVDPAGELCTIGYCGPAWVIDLTELDVVVSPDDERFIDFTLAAFDDPSEIDELWDEEDDKFFIYVEAGHSWTESDGVTTTSHFYMSGASVTMFVDAE